MTPVPRVLLVDDSPDDVELTLRAFRRQPLDVELLVARDGSEALSLIPGWDAGESWPALILLDIRMPKVTGIEVLASIKAHPALRTIPVVVLTTSRADRDIAAAYAAGANSYLIKPVNFEEFVETIRLAAGYWLGRNVPASDAAKTISDQRLA